MDKESTAKVTIIEVAAEAGVSFGTVSRVINNDIHVRKETRARVLKAMEKLGFVANRQARSLAGGRSNTIGVLLNCCRWYSTTAVVSGPRKCRLSFTAESMRG